MTPQEIIDNNKLLAEFLSIKNDGIFFDCEHIEEFHEILKISGGEPEVVGYILPVENLKFHNDWNWINKLLKHIGDKTEHELVSGYDYSYWNKYGENLILDKEGNPQEFGGYSDIINIYEACTAFVKWYNQNKGGN